MGQRPRHRLTVRHLYVLVPIAVVAWRAVTPLSDNSFLWHVRAGTLQLQAGEVLRSDPFSFTRQGEPWRTQSWLAELLYGRLEDLTGSVQWAPTLMFVVMGTALAFVGLAAYRVVRSPARTAVIMVAVAWVGMLFVVPRPVLFSFLLLAAFVVVLQHPERLGWTLIPLTWLWAAVHGLFVVGLALVALEAVRRRSGRMFGIGVLAGLTVLLTAHGVGIVSVLVEFAANRDALALLSEWKRPDFVSRGLAPAIAVAGAVVWAFWRRRLDLRSLIVAVPFVVLGFVQLRSVFPALIVLAPLAGAAISDESKTARPAVGSNMVNVGIASAIAVLAVIGLARPIGRDTGVLPSRESVAALSSDRVFHGPGAGGLLIWSEFPGREVFMDDRAELFGVEIFEDFIDARDGNGTIEILASYDLREALVKSHWPLVDTLVGEGWRETFRDDDWVVLVRP